MRRDATCSECGQSTRTHDSECYHIDCDSDDYAKHGCGPYIGLVVGVDYIQIGDQYGEIVRWDKKDWVQEPDVVPLIALAVQMYMRYGPECFRAGRSM